MASIGGLVLLGGMAYALVRALNVLRARVGVAWRFGLANIARRARVSVVQMLALGLGIMVLLLLSLVRADLLAGWQNNLPPDAPINSSSISSPMKSRRCRCFQQA